MGKSILDSLSHQNSSKMRQLGTAHIFFPLALNLIGEEVEIKMQKDMGLQALNEYALQK